MAWAVIAAVLAAIGVVLLALKVRRGSHTAKSVDRTTFWALPKPREESDGRSWILRSHDLLPAIRFQGARSAKRSHRLYQRLSDALESHFVNLAQEEGAYQHDRLSGVDVTRAHLVSDFERVLNRRGRPLANDLVTFVEHRIDHVLRQTARVAVVLEREGLLMIVEADKTDLLRSADAASPDRRPESCLPINVSRTRRFESALTNLTISSWSRPLISYRLTPVRLERRPASTSFAWRRLDRQPVRDRPNASESLQKFFLSALGDSKADDDDDVETLAEEVHERVSTTMKTLRTGQRAELQPPQDGRIDDS